VLSSGDWYKIAVLESGVFRLDHAFLSDIGLDLSNIDPRQIAIFGNANNGMLPQPNATPRADDLIENAIWVEGENDGKFDTEDYLLFYGRSPHHLSYNPNKENFRIEKNVYSDTTFYYLTIQSRNSKRIENGDNAIVASSYSYAYKRTHIHEKDKYSLINYGRYWYGEKFNSNALSHQILFDVPNRVADSPIEVYYSLLSTSKAISAYAVTVNEIKIDTMKLAANSTYEYATKATFATDTIRIDANRINDSDAISIDVNYERADNVSTGYIDYIHVITHENLDLSEGSISWFEESADQGFEITGINTKTRIWNITSRTTPQNLNISKETSSYKFAAATESAQYIAFNENQVLSPIFIKKVANQDLHGLASVDGIIITHKDFLSSAQQLANFRMAIDGLAVAVVTVEQIYNEFSSGSPDISAIRDFLKVNYDRYSQLKYVLLWGDASYDYRGILYEKGNYVPVYEARNSIHKLLAFSSDDYFGFMDDDEGEWIESRSGDHDMELGIGRIPIQSNQAGEAVVKKIIRYQTNKLGFGKWRNNLLFIADDGQPEDGNGSNQHQEQANVLSEYVESERIELNVNKFYLDAYAQLQTGKKSESAIDASTKLMKIIDDGALMVNYTGHGNEGLLTQESIFNESLIAKMTNNIKLPFFVTATCQFGNYDNPGRVSGGEALVMLPQGGAVGMLTSTRPVIASTNSFINRAFYVAAMEKENGKFRRLGDMMRVTKNTSLSGTNNRNYALLADPMLRLNFPNYDVVLTHINGSPLDQLDTLKAQGKYLLQGTITNNGETQPSYNGTVSTIVFGKHSKFKTLGDEGGAIQSYLQRDVILFQGDASVQNGLFDIEFIVPKNINYSFGEGKISFYAVNNTTTIDAHGAFSEVIVGGSVPNLSEDNNPPKIALFVNDTTFASGQTIGSSGILLAHLMDESGINTSSTGFGNEITMYLDNNEPITLNKYYSASQDTYKEGWLSFSLDNLAQGPHSLTLEASDVFNNETEKTIEFYVTDENGIKLSNIVNYPNPLSANNYNLTISFEHDRLGEDLDVELIILNLQGEKILREKHRFENVSENKLEFQWDLRKGQGSRVRKGMYIYRLKVRSRIDGSQSEVHRKIIVLN
jgi:hypothetical protein